MSSAFNTTRNAGQTLRLAREISRASNPRESFKLTTQDWLGFAPDLPEHIFGARAWTVGTVGLRAKYVDPTNTTGGVSLGIDVGYKQVDSANLPLEVFTSPFSTGPVVRMQSILRTNTTGVILGEYILTIVVFTGGDGSGTGSGLAGSAAMFRLDAGADWVKVTYQPHVDYPVATEMSGEIDGQAFSPSMASSAAFAAGAPSHDPSVSVGSGGDTTLGLPVVIYTNNIDPVYVFPATGQNGADGEHEYTELHAGGLEPFYARTCISWEGRMFYGSTSESVSGSQTRFPQRSRWSALYDASPDPSLPGSGFIDIRELSGQLLRYENLDPYLVAYYSDGIVFFERTGFAAAPIRYRVVSDHRGLLGGHAIAHISPREHFCIFTDGFYILNASGEFREIGVAEQEGKPFRKWHDYFFNVVDLTVAHRIQCHYDQFSKCVRITVPLKDSGKNTVWSYDILRDWMMVEGWSEQDAEVTCFVDHNATIRAGIHWDEQPTAPATWADATAAGGLTWDSGSALFGRENLYHATATGLVHQHDPDISTFNSKIQDWELVTARQPTPEIRNHTCWEGFYVELSDVGNDSEMTMKLSVQDMNGNEVAESDMSLMSRGNGNTGFLKLLQQTSRLSGAYGSFTLSGSNEVALRQIIADVRMSESRIRLSDE